MWKEATWCSKNWFMTFANITQTHLRGRWFNWCFSDRQSVCTGDSLCFSCVQLYQRALKTQSPGKLLIKKTEYWTNVANFDQNQEDDKIKSVRLIIAREMLRNYIIQPAVSPWPVSAESSQPPKYPCLSVYIDCRCPRASEKVLWTPKETLNQMKALT